MIVVDESIHGRRIREAIATWYQGQVVSVTTLRSQSIIKDDGISMLLRQVVQPTFVTINVTDFWLKFRADRRYCIVALALAQAQAHEAPGLLRRLLHLPEFHTKAARMGKVLHVLPTYVEYYEIDRQIQTVSWFK
ncbi:MAG: hypothetical protein U0350_29265 [Caldilineaceae bacterium]